MAEHLLGDSDNTDAPSPHLKSDQGRRNTGFPKLPEDMRYNMSHPRRGVALIFNNKTFEPETEMPERRGTDVDAARLVGLFESLGFKPHMHNDFTKCQMIEEVEKVAGQDHSDADCFAMAILSHGDEVGVYATDDVIPLHMFTGLLKEEKCPSLAGKPKLFFIQACRGMEFDEGAKIPEGEDQIDGIESTPASFFRHEPDVMVACCTVPGYFAWRNQRAGSFFIRAICDVFSKWGKSLEIMQLITRVNNQVAFQFESNLRGLSGMKQMPDISTTLIKELYFPAKVPET